MALLILETEGIELGFLDSSKSTVLHNASSHGSGRIIQTLVRRGVPLNIQNIEGKSALHIAVDNSHAKIVRYYLKKGAQSNLADSNGQYAIHLASWAGHLEIFKMLLETSANLINTQDNDGVTCLSMASEQGHMEIIKVLLENRASFIPDKIGETPIHKAAYSNHWKTLEMLLAQKEAKYNINFKDTNGNTALLIAASSGSLESLNLLLRFGASLKDRDNSNFNVLDKAAAAGHINILEHLSNHKLSDNKKFPETTLHKAALNGQYETVKFLCLRTHDFKQKDLEGRNPLHCAIASGKSKVVKYILSCMGDDELNQVVLSDSNGYSVIHLTAIHGDSDMLCLFLNLDGVSFDLNAPSQDGVTPIILALQHKHLDVAQALLRKGAHLVPDKRTIALLSTVPNEYLEIVDAELKTNISGQISLKVSKIHNFNALNIKRSGSTTTQLDHNTREESKTPDRVKSRDKKEGEDEFYRPKTQSFGYHTVSYRTRVKRKSIMLITPEVQEIVNEFGQNPSNAIDMLIEKKIVEDNSGAIAKFLFFRDDLDKTKLGLYLSEGKERNNAILDEFSKFMEFKDMDFDMALRRFVTKFRLPGEAQKIDRLMEKFAERYYALNPTTGPFANQDAVYILAFSVIMLNTDAHNPSIKKQNKMTKPQFINNNTGINNGENFPEKFLSDLYDKIVTYEIKMESEESQFLNAELKGWLNKQSGRIKTWKKRWLVLTDNCLLCFRTSSEKDPCAIIPLENLNILSQSGKKKFVFEMRNANEGPIKASVRKSNGFVVANHEFYSFQAASLEEMNIWIDSLNSNIYRNPFNQLLLMKKKELGLKKMSSPAKTIRKSKSSSPKSE